VPNIAHILTLTAGRYPQLPAIRLEERVWSYAELDEASARVAALLRARGLAPGDRVGLMLGNVPAFAEVYYGILRAGGIAVPLNVSFTAREVEHCLTDSGVYQLLASTDAAEAATRGAAAAGTPCIVVESEALGDELARYQPPRCVRRRRVADRTNGDMAVILHPSGSAEGPESAALSHGDLWRNVESVAERLFRLEPHDVVLASLPLSHAFGQTCALNAAVYSGACLVLAPRLEPDDVLGTITKHAVTVFVGIPTLYKALLRHPGAEDVVTGSLRLAATGDSELSVEALTVFEEIIRLQMLETPGSSSTAPITADPNPIFTP
jgi:long-chain acyl-CoA synthetase